MDIGTAKENVLQMVQRLPDDCTIDQILYHVQVIATLRPRLENIENEPGMPQEEFERRLDEWLESSGLTVPSPMSEAS